MSNLKAGTRVHFILSHRYDQFLEKRRKMMGSGFMKNLSRDLKEVNPDATCFSETNLLYMKNFYLLYQPYMTITPQVGEQFTQQVVEQGENAITPQLVEQIQSEPGGLVPVLTEPPSCGSFLYNKVEEGRGKILF